ncbi:Suppressor of cytokine signaling 6 [Manis javanica]|nr:Suppressor of cytokine signaling 6 [Manis javanica]
MGTLKRRRLVPQDYIQYTVPSHGGVPAGRHHGCPAAERCRRCCHPCRPEELKKLAKQGWYWGPITRWEADTRIEHSNGNIFLDELDGELIS